MERVTDDAAIDEIATEVRTRLERALDSIS
jgi:hypothetical protein